jgi:hypothetical protein
MMKMKAIAFTSVLTLLCSLPSLAENPRYQLGKIYSARPNQVWFSYEVVDILKLVDASLAASHRDLSFLPRTVMINWQGEKVFVKVGQVDLVEVAKSKKLFDGKDKPAAYFEIDLKLMKIVRFDLCKHECGIFRVPWFKANLDSRGLLIENH